MENQKYINVIYFDSINDPREIYTNIKYFKKQTNGAFIFCITINKFSDLMEKIKKEVEDNKKIIFFFI